VYVSDVFSHTHTPPTPSGQDSRAVDFRRHHFFFAGTLLNLILFTTSTNRSMWQGDSWSRNDTLDDVIDNFCQYSSSREAVALLWAVRQIVVREGFFVGSYAELFLRILLEFDLVDSFVSDRQTDIGDGSEQLQSALFRFVTDVTRRTDMVTTGPTDPHKSAHLFGLLLNVVQCDNPADVLDRCSDGGGLDVHLFCAPWPYITLFSPFFSSEENIP
jgi:hypothetical protein